MAAVQLSDDVHKKAKEKAKREKLELKEVAGFLFTKWVRGETPYEVGYKK